MSVARIWMLRPLPGRHEEAQALQEQVLNTISQQKGFLMGFSFVDPGGQIGRVALWESAEDATHAAQQEHLMALRSQINLLVEPSAATEWRVDVAGEIRHAE